jgi:hypothetical protein
VVQDIAQLAHEGSIRTLMLQLPALIVHSDIRQVQLDRIDLQDVMNLASQDTTDCKTPRVFLVLQELTQLKKESHLALHVLQDLTWDKVQARFVILVMLDDIRTPVDSQPVLLVILVHMLHLLQVLHVSNVLWLPTASSASALPAMFAQKVVGRTRMDPQPVSNAKKTRTLYVLKVLLFHGLEMVCSERQISLAISTPVFLQMLVYLLVFHQLCCCLSGSYLFEVLIRLLSQCWKMYQVHSCCCEMDSIHPFRNHFDWSFGEDD